MIVVDDASPDEAFNALQTLLREHGPGTTLVRHQENQGKGGSVKTGLRTALAEGFTHAVQVDADGQHEIADLPALLEVASAHPLSMVCGAPVFDDSISSLRKHARKITHYLCRFETLSTRIVDSMCGFRIYPLERIVTILDGSRTASRMGFDPEILVRACWAGIELRYVPVRVSYPQSGRSHYHYFRDNLEITWMHIRLIFGLLLRLPLIAWRRMRT
jgi:glycosyltransferase involved in cell wall biosynthesis